MEDIATGALTQRTQGVLARIERDLNAQPDEHVIVTAASNARLGGTAIVAVSILDVDYRLYRDGAADGGALSLGVRPLPPEIDGQVRDAMLAVMGETGSPTYQMAWRAGSADVPEASHPGVDDPIVALAVARLMDEMAERSGQGASCTRH